MSGQSSLEVQKAIYGQLVADGELASLKCAVYDWVPTNATLPYLRVGEDDIADESTFGVDRASQDVTLHGFSTYPGRKEIKSILARTYELLHKSKLQLEGTSMWAGCVLVFEATIEEEDGVTYHGVQRFRIVTTEALRDEVPIAELQAMVRSA